MWHFIVVVLVVLPIDKHWLPDEVPPDAWTALRETAEALQLVEPGRFLEQQYFGKELVWLREQILECQDAPPGEDAFRFPTLQVCEDRRAVAQRHVETLYAFANTQEKEWAIADELEDAFYRIRVWRTLVDIQEPRHWLCLRRKDMKELRRLLGDEDYYRGALPLPVPLERFKWVK